MSRVLTFELIGDSRMQEHPGRVVLGYACDIRDRLTRIGVNYNEDVYQHPMYRADFDDGTYQVRMRMSIRKTRKITWRDIMREVNSVYSPVYKYL